MKLATLLLFSVITGAVRISHSWSNVPLCYTMENANSRIEFSCSNCEILPPANCSNTTLSEAIQNLDFAGVKELKMCGCAGIVVISTVEMFKNLSVLDIAHSKYQSFYRSKPHLDLVKLFHVPTITKLNASHNNLADSFMVFPPSNITVLDLSHNRFYFLIDNFKNLKNLELLDLSNTDLHSMETFANLPRMKILRLESNPIDSYNCEVFSRLRNRVTIYISWPNINRLYMDCGHINNVRVRLSSQESVTYNNGEVEMNCRQNSLRNLRYLHIARFQIIDSSLGRSLTSVRWLCVSNSKASEFDFDPLRHMTNLEHLDVSGNDFKRVKNWDVLRKLRKLESLSAEENRIRNAFEMIPNLSSSVVHLNLSGNDVGRINSTVFDELDSLEQIGLQNAKLQFGDSNPFHRLTDLNVLEISHNDLSNVDLSRLASTLGNLEVFKADGCRLKNVSQIIKLLGGGIRQIDLSGNDLSEVTISTAFSTFQRLDVLRLSYCGIKNVADLRVKRRSIRSLDLSGNPIGEVSNDTFNHLRELGELYLSDTNLSISYPDPFDYIVSWRSLVFLHYLDLSKNDLSALNFSMLALTIGKLDGINLSNCRIKNVTNVIQVLNPSIRRLDLSGNFIGEWTSSPFYSLKHISSLNLANTSLWNFTLNFPKMARLEMLNISFNHLKTLEIIPLDLLETLDLRGNELSEISKFTRENLPLLKFLGISENRLSCKFLERLNGWRDLKFIDNHWNQKDVNCHPI